MMCDESEAVFHLSLVTKSLLLYSFAVDAAKGCEQGAVFGLRGADASQPVLVCDGRRLNLNRLQTHERLARERAVERALQRVPGKLKRLAHISPVNKDTPAPLVHLDQA